MAESENFMGRTVKSMTALEGGVKILLDIDRVLTNDEVSSLRQAIN